MRMIIHGFNIDVNIDNSSYQLIIENRAMFVKYVSELQNESLDNDLIYIVDEDNKKLKLSDNLDVLTSLFNLDINCKKNINAIGKQIKLLYKEELIGTLNNIEKNLINCFDNIKLDYHLDLISDVAVSEEDIIKLLDIKINDSSNNILERIVTYMKVAIELRKIKVFIFVALSIYLEAEDIRVLLYNARLLDVLIIDLETINVINNYFDYKKILDFDICLLE